MKRKRIGYLALFLAMATTATACSGNTNGETTTPTDSSGKKVELKFATWGNPAQLELYQGLFAKFNESHPNIEVKIDSIPFADYQQKISVLAAGRELPDIAWISERMVPQFMANDILGDITDVAADPTFNRDDIIPSTLDLFRKDGKLYGVPFSTPPSVVFYNRDLFEKAGLTSPNELAEQGKWTWEEFVKSAKLISDGPTSGRTYGANFFRDWKTWIMLASYSWSNGSAPFKEDMSKFTWNDAYGVETLKMLQTMMFVDKSHPKAGEQVSFESGKLGMIFDNYSFVSKARTIKDFKWSIAPMPSGSQGTVPMMGQAGYVLFKESKHPKEAKELIKFLAGQEGIQTTSAFFVPPRQSVLGSDAFLKQEGNPDPADIKQAVIDEMPKAKVQPGHIQWQKIDTEILSGFDRLFGQSGAPEEILKGIKEKVDPLLNK
ncbi:ABC transporter substrate-binding protein [Paenibacillus herberti]|uniref:Sugar ABC transporter substrate-binding protein n=1 Tax=Paenibacillus herberti TaxID=1619309 RepID=A0A229P3L8_9BACL|nr:sugar ABC transporter substrate-binding protein [Paenibacillus herberti]OXM16843.1 sugar ABC transporter substrate-binding protein [Paenibacillus herberti]